MPTPSVHKIQTIVGHQAPIYSLLLDKSYQFLFSADTNGMLVKWDLGNLDNGTLLARLQTSIYSAFLEENLLFVGQNFEGIHLLDLYQNKLIASSQITKAAIFDLKTTKKYIFVAAADGRLSILDKYNLKTFQHIQVSEKSLRCLAICEEKNEIAVGCSDNFIRIFDSENFSLKYEWQAHELSVFCLCFAPNNLLLSGGRDAHLKIWDSQKNYILINDVIAHLFTINHIAYSPDNQHFATCSKDKSIKLWDAQNFRLLKVIDKGRHAGHGTSVNKLAWLSPNRLFSCSDDQTISLWQIDFV